MHSHIQQDLFDAWIDAIGFSWIREDERYKTAPQHRQSRGPDRAQPADLRPLQGKDRRRMARDLPPEPRLRRRDDADHAGSAAPRTIPRQRPRRRNRRSARRQDGAARPLRQDERDAGPDRPAGAACPASTPPRCSAKRRGPRRRIVPRGGNPPAAARRHHRARMRRLAGRALRRGAAGRSRRDGDQGRAADTATPIAACRPTRT